MCGFETKKIHPSSKSLVSVVFAVLYDTWPLLEAVSEGSGGKDELPAESIERKRNEAGMVVDIFIGHLVWGTTLPVIVRNLAPSIAKRLDLGCSAPLACSRGTPDARRQTSEDHRLSGRPPALPPRAIRRKLSISSRISRLVHVEKRRQRAVGLYFAANVEPGRFGTSKRETPNRRSAPSGLSLA